MADDAAAAAQVNPLAPRPPHYPAKAKRVIFLFMHGGPSQVDTFDYKPLLTRDHGRPLPFAQAARRFQPNRQSAEVALEIQSARSERALWVSELFPNVAGVVRRLVPDSFDARLQQPPRRSAVGTAHRQRHLRAAEHGLVDHLWPGQLENQDPPGFITVCPTLTHGAENNYSSAFLPAAYQGTPLGNASIAAEKAQHSLHSKRRDVASAVNASSSTVSGRWTRSGWRTPAPTPCSKAASTPFELAFRMQATHAAAARHLRRDAGHAQALRAKTTPSTKTSAGSV